MHDRVLLVFTEEGLKTAGRIRKDFPADMLFNRHIEGGIKSRMEEILGSYREVVFISAMGIAVRFIAPYIKDKRTDPAVLVVNDTGRFVIPVISGHIGGANSLAERIADSIDAEAVITTASDHRGFSSLDIWMEQEGLCALDKKTSTHVMTDMVNGKRIAYLNLGDESRTPPDYTGILDLGDGNLKGLDTGDIPLILIPKDSRRDYHEIIRIMKDKEYGTRTFKDILVLLPRNITLGTGVRRNTDPDGYERFVFKTLDELKVFPERIREVVSIDLKKDEKAILDFCRRSRIPFRTESSEYLKERMTELEEEGHIFQISPFVKKTTGIGCVSEICALTGGKELLCVKRSENGMTLSVSEDTVKERNKIRNK